jgi:hypothetical protein
MGNDEKEGVETKIPRCDHRDYMKERTDILDKLRNFLAIKCDHGDERKKAEHKAFLTRKLDCHSSSMTHEITPKWM